MTTKTMRLVKFGAEWCGPCQSMAKNKTLEKFVDEHDDLELKIVDVDKNEKLANKYDVKGIPCFVFETLDKVELVRGEGAMSVKQLEKLYERAQKALDEGVGEEEDEDGEEEDDDLEDDEDEDDED